MTAFVALVALACGVFGFGESLGTSPAAVVVHLFAVAVVLGCVPVLARAQVEIAGETGSLPLPANGTRVIPGLRGSSRSDSAGLAALYREASTKSERARRSSASGRACCRR